MRRMRQLPPPARIRELVRVSILASELQNETNRSAQAPLIRVDACVCTFRRETIADALRSLGAQNLPAGCELRVIVADNDDEPSARPRVEAAAAQLTIDVIYVHAPARNISIARNACLDASDAEWLAFLDDDEIAPPDWIAKMLARAQEGGFDAVFGPAVAEYDAEAPDWITASDYHSNRIKPRNGEVQTGHTCNALIRRTNPDFASLRFRLEKGRTGGEDTELFFRMWRGGARLGYVEDAPVFEPVNPARLSFAWIRKRKFRAGLSYGAHSLRTFSAAERTKLFASAAGKAAFSGLMAAMWVFAETRRNFWALRAVFHAGVCAAAFNVAEAELYGTPASEG